MIELSDEVKARVSAFTKTPLADRWKQPKAVRAALIADLAKHDYSAADMSFIFGCSRNAVIGFASRQEVKLGGHEKHSMRSTKRADRAPAPRREPRLKKEPKRMKFGVEVVAKNQATPKKPEPIAADPNAALTIAPRVTRVHILDADYTHCRFPLWGSERKPSVEEMFFCGAAKEDILKPYCKACARSGLSYAAPEMRRAA
ncbi:GcrA family cell cycle regulator [Mesorhizobium sp. Cs1299R1N3]|uniref:GcrA family cell cycle regulator n=1 Tax=Mesorhizobium sp. Cs1299R1N3 TaxID=3015173 RepID=UPI00301E515D